MKFKLMIPLLLTFMMCQSSMVASQSHERSRRPNSQKQHCNNCASKTTYIKSLPYVIHDSGKYELDCDLCFDAKAVPGKTVAIRVLASGVTIDGNSHSIDMLNKAGTAVLLDGIEAIEVVNLNVRNSGDPGDVPVCSNLEYTGFNYGYENNVALLGQQAALDQLVTPTNYAFTSVLANDPYSGVGIAIHAAEGVVIRNCNFDHMFCGIAGISTSNDPENIDESNNIVITNCTGSECGFIKPDSPYLPGEAPQVFRGAFIAFQASQFFGPVLAAPFYHGNIENPVDEYPEVFGNITIEDCNAGSEVAQAGIFLNYANSCVVRNCNMRLTPETPLIGVYVLNSTAPFLGYFNHALYMVDCTAQGGYNSIYFNLGLNEVFERCIAQYHYNTGINIWYAQYPVLKNCTVSEGLDLGLTIAQTDGIDFVQDGVGYGIQFLVNYMGLAENNSMSNYRAVSYIQTTTNYFPPYNNFQDALGFTGALCSYCTFKGNNVFNNMGGMFIYPSDHCTFENNLIWANGTDFEPGGVTRGIVAGQSSAAVGMGINGGWFGGQPAPIDGDPLQGNKYIGNRFMNNGQGGASNIYTTSTPTNAAVYAIGMPFLVTSVFQDPLAPIPVNANIQETPSIFLRSDYDLYDIGADCAGFSPDFAYLNAAATANVQQGDTITLLTDVWQGVASSTRPIISYSLLTPNPARGTDGIIGPQATGTFTLCNTSTADVGYYQVVVEFDIGDLPLPALPSYKSNAFCIDRVVPSCLPLTPCPN